MRKLTSAELSLVAGGSHMPSAVNDPSMLSAGGPFISLPGGGAFTFNAGTAAAEWFTTDTNGNGSWLDDASSRAESLSVFTAATGGGLALLGGPAGAVIGLIAGLSSLSSTVLSIQLRNEFDKQQEAESGSDE